MYHTNNADGREKLFFSNINNISIIHYKTGNVSLDALLDILHIVIRLHLYILVSFSGLVTILRISKFFTLLKYRFTIEAYGDANDKK